MVKSAAAQPLNAAGEFNDLKVGEADRFKAAEGGDLTVFPATGWKNASLSHLMQSAAAFVAETEYHMSGTMCE
jgi:hypothetical protein